MTGGQQRRHDHSYRYAGTIYRCHAPGQSWWSCGSRRRPAVHFGHPERLRSNKAAVRPSQFHAGPHHHSERADHSPRPFYSAGQTAIGNPVLGANGVPLAGGWAISPRTASSPVALTIWCSTADNNQGTVAFVGPVSITARGGNTVANGGLLSANSTVNLSAPYVELGQPFQPPLASSQYDGDLSRGVLPTFGPGQFNVNAPLIDIGNLSLQNIGQATFNAINGDIRGDGTLDVAGAIVMRAGQIYPATEVNFTIAASDYIVGGVTQLGSVTILPGAHPPASAFRRREAQYLWLDHQPGRHAPGPARLDQYRLGWHYWHRSDRPAYRARPSRSRPSRSICCRRQRNLRFRH